jgi:quinoprotein relay system zinc metallohydrolase 2
MVIRRRRPARGRRLPCESWLTRRRALGSVLLALGAGLTPRLVVGRAQADQIAAPLVEVADGVFVREGVHQLMTPDNLGHVANVGCVLGEEAIAVIDSGGSAIDGRRFREEIRRITDRPVAYVIATHVHPDHLFGHAAFKEDAPVFVGHARLPASLDARGAFYLDNLRRDFGELAAGTEVIKPDLLVEEETEIDLGGRLLTLKAHPTAHTDNDLTAFDRKTGFLFAGDLVFMERLPVLDGRLLGWLEVIEDLRRLEATAVIPGHGPASAGWPDALDAEERYLTRLRDELRVFLADGGFLEDAVQTLAFEDEQAQWRLFEQDHGRNVSAAYAELEWE